MFHFIAFGGTGSAPATSRTPCECSDYLSYPPLECILPNFVLKRNSVYQLPKLKKIKSLIHGFSTKQEGNMSLSFGVDKEVYKNREQFLRLFNTSPENCVKMTLQHGTNIEVVGKNHKTRGMFQENSIVADALITKEKGMFLFLVVADCLPIIFYDPVKTLAGLAHVGWKGTDQKLAKKVVQKLSKLGSHPKDLLVGIGPGIHKKSYVHKDPSQNRRENWKPFLQDLPDGQTAIDIVGYNVQQTIDAGIPKENIEVSDINTAVSDDFFSHYRSKRTGEPEGRFAAVVGMV